MVTDINLGRDQDNASGVSRAEIPAMTTGINILQSSQLPDFLLLIVIESRPFFVLSPKKISPLLL